MQTIDRKLIRDFRRLWIQALAIALVLACGVSILLTSVGMYTALSDTRLAYYERNRFADIFVNAKRAPSYILDEIADIEGVLSVEGRITGDAILDLPGRTKGAVGRILSYPEDHSPVLNVPLLVEGRFPNPQGVNEVAVNVPFAEANGFRLGDRLVRTCGGKT